MPLVPSGYDEKTYITRDIRKAWNLLLSAPLLRSSNLPVHQADNEDPRRYDQYTLNTTYLYNMRVCGRARFIPMSVYRCLALMDWEVFEVSTVRNLHTITLYFTLAIRHLRHRHGLLQRVHVTLHIFAVANIQLFTKTKYLFTFFFTFFVIFSLFVYFFSSLKEKRGWKEDGKAGYCHACEHKVNFQISRIHNEKERGLFDWTTNNVFTFFCVKGVTRRPPPAYERARLITVFLRKTCL